MGRRRSTTFRLVLAGVGRSGLLLFVLLPHADAPGVLQQPRSLRAARSAAWVTRLSKAGRDVGFLVIPPSRTVAMVGVAAAFETGVFFVNDRPHPTQCAPLQVDKWQHCFVGCEISSWYPCGAISGSLLAFVKEIWDSMGHGRVEWADIIATLRGTWDCPASESCEEFCCGQFG